MAIGFVDDPQDEDEGNGRSVCSRWFGGWRGELRVMCGDKG